MSQTTTILKEINAFLFGRKYYANIINTKGTDKTDLCSFIFRTKEEAQKHRQTLDSTLAFRYIETVSFRSRKEY